MKKVFLIAGVLAVALLAAAFFYLRPAYKRMISADSIKFDPHLTVYLGSGNSIVLKSQDNSRALIVDTKMMGAAKRLKDAVTAETVTIVNTHAHIDHAGGNDLYPSARIIAGDYPKEQWALEGNRSRYPDETLKPGEERTINFDDERVHVRHMGNAHTLGDVVVFLEKRKMLLTGDLVWNGIHPAVYTKSKCNTRTWSAALDSLLKRYDAEVIVPGHGPMCDKNGLTRMKDYFESIRGALDNPAKLAQLREKYKKDFELMFMTGFDMTVEFIKKEKAAGERP
jgi:glyoxylase-like metal-dependent hydrolase (beta-lactamase superfamily II)